MTCSPTRDVLIAFVNLDCKDEGVLESIDSICARVGVELSDTEEEPAEPHWSELDPPTDEATGTKVLRYTWRTGFYVLSIVDAVGEWLAEALGITTPRYQYVINELINMQDEAREEKKAEEEAIAEARRIEAEAAKDLEDAGGTDASSSEGIEAQLEVVESGVYELETDISDALSGGHSASTDA
eukprot:m.740423 g.740423  ORF g.740423 m.740423 type:complete len:184 (-) comp23115_c1_seq5:281-832(-)